MPSLAGRGLYLRLSSFYFFYFASVGVIIPFWSLYLQAQKLDAAAIGTLLAVPMATKLIAPYLWGLIADRSGRRVRIIRATSAAAVVCFAGVFLGSGFWWLLLALLGFSFFWNASLPQFEAVTMTHLRSASERYAGVRVWGSVGFVLTSLALGPVLQRFGIGLVPVVMLAMFAGIWLASLAVPEAPGPATTEPAGAIAPALKQPPVAALFLVCFLVQASHGPYYGFYSIYLQSHGYSHTAVGFLWALGVIAEVLLFLLMHRLLPRYGARNLMLSALALTVLRWLLIGWLVASPAVVLFAQLLHAFSFGVYHAVAISLVHRFFPDSLQGRGQALYSSLSFGAGGSLGIFASGLLWEHLSPAVTFTLAAVAAAVGWLVALSALHPEHYRGPLSARQAL